MFRIIYSTSKIVQTVNEYHLTRFSPCQILQFQHVLVNRISSKCEQEDWDAIQYLGNLTSVVPVKSLGHQPGNGLLIVE